jgi:plasmid stabilization system protein ParE
MSGFVFHPDALNDLNEIGNFIAVDNLAAADRVLQEINDTIRALLPFPH